MSGNKERLTMAMSEAGFARSCPHCGDARELRFKTPSYYYSVRLAWSNYNNKVDIRRRDFRTTTKSFQRHKLYCASCRGEITDKRIRQQAVDLVLAEAGRTRYW